MLNILAKENKNIEIYSLKYLMHH